MNTKFILNVDVPGEMGTNTFTDHRFSPFKVYHLHFIFDSYPDDIFTSFPVYVVSENLLNKILDLGFSGIDNPRLITYSEREDYFSEEHTSQNYFMVDIYENQEDDFSLIRINNLIRLCVSDRAYSLLSSFKIDNADISELK